MVLVVEFDAAPSMLSQQGLLRQTYLSHFLYEEQLQANVSALVQENNRLKAKVKELTEAMLPEQRSQLKAAAQPQVRVNIEHTSKLPNGEEVESLVGHQKLSPTSATTQILKYLSPPSTLPYNLKSYTGKMWGKYIGQMDQDRWVDGVFGKAKGLFVVESGANDGESGSNSLFLETQRGWECLLVEANPHLVPEILALHRKCHLLASGISMTGDIGSFPFKLAGTLGGFTKTASYEQSKRIDAEIKAGMPWMAGQQGSGGIVDVPAFPLPLVMKALGKTVIDYWSLDTEGSEVEILRHTDFSQIEVGVMSIEHAGSGENGRKKIMTAMKKAGFKRVRKDGLDDYYANPAYFAKRNIPFPA
eukprot:gnl/TRDRNA2_/TRDRNA2_82097_c1_seq1.p1 gnl/TRDRNA2_/TRDRNA2_82097_c1~~gnl/TRDRNA2_/TRDRNA2_82097_c1_seq1.p1  ORF type:complete len:417 (-),score=78.01 gnl/TRDRNA2_/TRDRNA2_82097_c1_seq1:52-1131(-)